jgi:hypothetical protein
LRNLCLWPVPLWGCCVSRVSGSGFLVDILFFMGRYFPFSNIEVAPDADKAFAKTPITQHVTHATRNAS